MDLEVVLAGTVARLASNTVVGAAVDEGDVATATKSILRLDPLVEVAARRARRCVELLGLGFEDLVQRVGVLEPGIAVELAVPVGFVSNFPA